MNVLTFDIEEWFHILDNDSTKTESEWGKYERRLDANMERILGILNERNLKATFFCLGWVAREFQHVIKRIVEQGHELATHSDLHQLAYEQTPAEFFADLELSIKSLEDVSGTRIRAYRAPGFSLKEGNKWIFEELIRAGIEVDCSVFPANRSHGGFSGFGAATPSLVETESGMIHEFPINTTKLFGMNMIFSGGGYFRLLPEFLLKRYIQRSDYVMTYFHPRDFDPGQPMIPGLSLARRFKSYYGLRGAQKKLESLLDSYDFISLADAEKTIDWTNVPTVSLLKKSD
ncbi:polysaccharide deacetylase family protein [Akkermansiaceae bacterium]|nr:polysaccharide deacetylase family protein [Akkermansiaceae bacterium]